ncbi:MAG: hypothetical protein P8J87_17645, partial [Verrucomicrobiales bacterium]|nr:hypothetical protein [Verrucomicrobiales bacterium]
VRNSEIEEIGTGSASGAALAAHAERIETRIRFRRRGIIRDGEWANRVIDGGGECGFGGGWLAVSGLKSRLAKLSK